MVILTNVTDTREKNISLLENNYYSSKFNNKLDTKLSYQELLNVVVPAKSEREKFFKICSYVIQTGKPEIYFEQSHMYEQKIQYSNPEFSFHTFLCNLESALNMKRQYLSRDFSNYTEVLAPEQVQEFYTVVPKTEVLDFLHMFFTFELNADAVFLFLLLSHWHKLTDETVYNAFLNALDQHPLPSDFEFGIKYLDLPALDQWLVVDTRFVLILALRYLAEHPNAYEKLKKTYASWYEYLLQQQMI